MTKRQSKMKNNLLKVANRKAVDAMKKKMQIKKRKKMFFDRQRGLCKLCGESMSYEECNIDHIVPTSRGGRDANYNIQATHKSCNSIKGSDCDHHVSREIRDKITEHRKSLN